MLRVDARQLSLDHRTAALAGEGNVLLGDMEAREASMQAFEERQRRRAGARGGLESASEAVRRQSVLPSHWASSAASCDGLATAPIHEREAPELSQRLPEVARGLCVGKDCVRKSGRPDSRIEVNRMCGGVNEAVLPRGTRPETVFSIVRSDVNERFTSRGHFGYGSYLVEDAGFSLHPSPPRPSLPRPPGPASIRWRCDACRSRRVSPIPALSRCGPLRCSVRSNQTAGFNVERSGPSFPPPAPTIPPPVPPPAPRLGASEADRCATRGRRRQDGALAACCVQDARTSIGARTAFSSAASLWAMPLGRRVADGMPMVDHRVFPSSREVRSWRELGGVVRHTSISLVPQFGDRDHARRELDLKFACG
ncbi:unnamed protein product [Prorocentrum cordatum]|uniref:Poly [ADP-ribose] polymerase n=1 Tax=Prorocentrum cordatum TaxID=2364126 RepID=A0ABN9PJA2_9DINO|nr:unnamed protein product [Polarella glacialis]